MFWLQKTKNTLTITIFTWVLLGNSLFPNKNILAKELQIPEKVNILLSHAEDAISTGDYQKAISSWLEVISLQELDSDLESKQLASIHENIASVEWLLGNSSEAVRHWQKSAQIYRQETTSTARLHLAAVLIDLSKAYNDLGQPRFSISLLNEAISIIEENSHWQSSPKLNSLKSIANLTLGNAYSIQSDYERAIKIYHQSLKTQEKLSPELQISTWNNLSHSYQQRANQLRQKLIAAKSEENSIALTLELQEKRARASALSAAQMAVKTEPNNKSLERARALIQLSKLSNVNNHQLLDEAQTIVLSQPNSSQKVYSLIEIASIHNPQFLLSTAATISEKIENPRIASFALGALGKYYEKQQRYELALNWTQQAQFAARQAQAQDSLYQWYWQAGRIFKAQGQTFRATTAYENALASVQSIRSDLAQANSDLTFNFQTDIEPVYRQYLELLLDEPSQPNLRRALEVRELLQISELENFFEDDCLTIERTSNQELEGIKRSSSAIVTTIILPKRTHVIWQLPNAKLTTYSLPVSKTQLENLVEQWRYDLENLENDNYFLTSQRFYNLLFAPIRAELSQLDLETLVFVNDGILRNVPMAALHDGNNFLLSDFAIVNSLGLKLKIQFEREPLTPKRALLFGLTAATKNFAPLPYVAEEIEAVSQTIAEERQFIDREFDFTSFQRQIANSKKASVIHIATHGIFTGTIENSFLQAWNQKIGVKDLENVLNERNLNYENKIQLLFLSACDTARGNERATLGMSGVALRSGVNSVVGSLWSIGDRSSATLVKLFYRYLVLDNLSLEESLRQAQLDLLSTPGSHPAIWSGFTSIQN